MFTKLKKLPYFVNHPFDYKHFCYISRKKVEKEKFCLMKTKKAVSFRNGFF